jgi:hypothetical protein
MRPTLVRSFAALAAVAAAFSATGVAAAKSVKPPHSAIVRKEARVARGVGGSVLPVGATVNTPLQGGGSTGQGSATDADCNHIVVVVNNLQQWGNQQAVSGDAEAYNQAYEQSQKYVDDGESAGCFFIY